MLIVADRVKETSATVGVGALALAGAAQGFRAFASVCAVSDQVGYAIEAPNGDWEVGLGTYSAANQLTRTRVDASSNAGAVVAFGAGDKNVFLTAIGKQLSRSIKVPISLPVVSSGAFMSRAAWAVSARIAGGGAATNATDNNTGTRYATGAVITPGTDWFQIDIGSVQPVGSVIVDVTGAVGDVPLSGDIRTSSDGGVTFPTTIASWTTAANLTGALLIVNIPGAAVNTRYVRLYATGLANGASTNWWSIAEINLSATNVTPAAENVATETVIVGAKAVLRTQGYVAKTDATDWAFRIGADANNWYGFIWTTNTLKIQKRVAGVTTDLVNSGGIVVVDLLPHHFEFLILTDVSGALNWLSCKMSHSNGSTVWTQTTTDGSLDMTVGAKTFRAFYANSSVYRGWGFTLGPSL